MKNIYRKITVTEKSLPCKVDYVQGTNEIPIVFEIVDYNIPENATANIYIKKPSGKNIYNSCEISENTITVQPTTQMFIEHGKQYGTIQILDATKTKILESFVILFDVSKSMVDDAAVESTDEFTALQEIMQTAPAAITAAQEAAQAAQQAAENAQSIADTVQEKLDNGDFVGPQGPPGSIDNLDQQPITFTEATDKSPLESGDTLGVLFGKTKKYQSENDEVVYEIGGRNLILDSENIEFNASGGASVTKESDVTVSEWGTDKAKRIYGTGGSSALTAIMRQGTYPKTGDYTLSIYIKNNGAKNVMVGRVNRVTVNPGEAVLVCETTKNVTSSSEKQIQIYTETAGDSFDVTYWHPKIEIGSTPTRWTPAPEDYTTNLLDDDTIQSAENVGITGETGKTLLNSVLQKTLINPIVESYTDESWYIQKYANGDCTATTAIDVTTDANLTGSAYVTPNETVILPNGLFTEITFPVGISNVTGCSFYRFTLSGTSSLQFNLWSVSERKGVSGQVFLKIEGKWI